ncbi:MAG TPA: tRNA lysidine(34) synthetase TilS [Solirubrobacteraceae bacterium]|nr:tRNA lysidine(34) synthetase TilS [Solirubrobacteraceae bacterium]
MIVEQIREAVRAGGLLWDARPPEGDEILARPAQPVIAMVSGGRDSTCLVDVAVALCAPGSVMALHVNYELRGAESDSDERHCRALCESLGVELEIVHARRPKGEAGNLQAWARDVRYKAAMRMTERENALLAAGHTATDQVETVLYRLAASPGRRALLGMSAREGRLVRPLLGMTRAQTAAYCRERGLQWREDASNVSDTYARGRVRHGLMAALGAVHPAAEANVLRTAQLLREETELLEGLVEGVLEGGRSVAIERLEELPVALGRLVVISLAEQAAGTYVPQAGDRVGEILELARRGGRLDLHVGGNVSARIEGGTLSMVKLPPR